MFRLDTTNRRLIALPSLHFNRIGLREGFQVEEWIEQNPAAIVGEDLLIIAKQWITPSVQRLDLLAVDRTGGLVIVHVARDEAGSDTMSRGFAGVRYVSNLAQHDVVAVYARTLKAGISEAQIRIEEYLATSIEALNRKQRLIVVGDRIDSETTSQVVRMAKHFGIEGRFVEVHLFFDSRHVLFLTVHTIIPLHSGSGYACNQDQTHHQPQRSPATSRLVDARSHEQSELARRWRNILWRRTGLPVKLWAMLQQSVERLHQLPWLEIRRFQQQGNRHAASASRPLLQRLLGAAWRSGEITAEDPSDD